MITSGQINLDNGSKINIIKSSMKLAEISIKDHRWLLYYLHYLTNVRRTFELFYDGIRAHSKNLKTNMVTISTRLSRSFSSEVETSVTRKN